MSPDDTSLRAMRPVAADDAAASSAPTPFRRRGAIGRLAPLAGPAILASVAYMDPGNIATNIEAGARFAYRLLWVVLLANVTAMLFQALSAKLGIVTGRSLAELCRDRLPAPVVYAMWAVSEIAAMATDVAEFLGASIGFALLLHIPLLAGVLITGVVTYLILMLQKSGRSRRLEAVVGVLVGLLCLCYVVEVVLAGPDWGQVAVGTFLPRFGGPGSVVLAAGIVGATVMPHAIFLHSGLARDSVSATERRHGVFARAAVRLSHVDVALALGMAGIVNLAMVCVAAAVFAPDVETGRAASAGIEEAYRTLGPLLGNAAAAVFLVALLASGLSSSVVGTMAGQVIMQDFVHWRIPLWVRRIVTMLPTVAIVALGVDATEALVMSQVVLSLVLPVPMIALLVLTSRRSVMGAMASSRTLTLVAGAATLMVLTLNLVLILDAFGVSVL